MDNVTRVYVFATFLVVACASSCESPPPPPPPLATCDIAVPPPAPERIVLDDCSSLVDLAALAPVPKPPPCPAPADPVPSLCPDGGAAPGGVVESQEQLEAYRGCTSITDRLTIVGACSLAPLASVEIIEGLEIGVGAPEGDTGALTIVDLDGLQSLRTVERSFAISGPSLASLAGLDVLESVAFDFEVRFAPSLARLSGPPTLREVGGEINVGFNDGLVLVDGFDALVDVGGGSRPEGALRFGHNGALRCIDGFASLPAIDEIELEGTSIVAMPALNNAIVAGAPTIKLIDATAFDVLTLPAVDELRGLTFVRPPPSMTDLRAFSALVTLGSLRIVQTDLQNVGGLDGVVSLDSIEIEDNDALSDITALSGVTQVGAVRLQGDARFDVTCAFTGTTSAAELTLRRTTFEVVPWPRTLTRIDALVIVENEQLADLGDTEATLGDAMIAFNTPLTNADAETWLAERDVGGVAKYGSNAGIELDPCPWVDDGVCDVGICATDSEDDCPPVK